MAKTIIPDLNGRTFTRLTVITPIERNANKQLVYKCQCQCGNLRYVFPHSLVSGNTKSCGCLKRDTIRAAQRTHGLSKTPTYIAWAAMHSRCTCPTNAKFADYGGRGITICDRWLNSFANFLTDMGEKPSPKHTVDRQDNSLGYTPENCIWATRKEQANNKRNNHLLTFQERSQTMAQWCSELGLSYTVVRSRLNRLGWSVEKALTIPVASDHRGHSKLRSTDIPQIRAMRKAKIGQIEVATRFHVSTATISLIDRGIIWKEY